MGTANFSNDSIESYIVTLCEKMETMKSSQQPLVEKKKFLPAQAELRTLDLWRSTIGECFATFCFVFMICSCFIPWDAHSPPLVSVALVTGFGAATLTKCFDRISGAHMNPAITCATVVLKRISPLRGGLFVTAQCGGAIAGSALLYGVTESVVNQGNLGASLLLKQMSNWQGFAIEMILSFILVYTYLIATCPTQKIFGNPALTIGMAYLACTLVAKPATGGSFNPARSLGPAFVIDNWNGHWVYWFGPVFGALLASVVYQLVFIPRKSLKPRKQVNEGDGSSIHSEDVYDEVSHVRTGVGKACQQQQHYLTIQNASGQPPAHFYPTLPYNPVAELPDSLYAGTRSLYAKSPTMNRRPGLNRSQSVYTKGGTGGIATKGAQMEQNGHLATSTVCLPQPAPLTTSLSIHTTKPGGFGSLIPHQTSTANQNLCNESAAALYTTRLTNAAMPATPKMPQLQQQSAELSPRLPEPMPLLVNHVESIYGTTKAKQHQQQQHFRVQENPIMHNPPQQQYVSGRQTNSVVPHQQQRKQDSIISDSTYGSYKAASVQHSAQSSIVSNMSRQQNMERNYQQQQQQQHQWYGGVRPGHQQHHGGSVGSSPSPGTPGSAVTTPSSMASAFQYN